MAVDYCELPGSPIETWSLTDGLSATRRVLCLWGERYACMAQFLTGLGVVYEHHGGGALRARNGSITPAEGEMIPGSGTMAGYEHAVLQINYAVPDIAQTGAGDLYSESLEPAIEFLTNEYTKFTWADGTAIKPDEAPGKPMQSMDYTLTRYGLAAVPAAAKDLIGKVNHATVTANLLGMTFPAKTLLYNPPVLNRKINTDMASAGWNLTYRFSYRENGWNKFWRADKADGASWGAWDSMKVVGGGAYDNFPTGDFGDLYS